MSIDMIFGDYKIIRKIATGGMAEVFLAKRMGAKGFEKLLAIKRVLPQFSENEDFISMFIDEAKLVAQLNHRNIVKIYDFGHQQGSYYIAMDYIFGKDVRSILKRSAEKQQPIPSAQSVYLITEAAKGLDYAHNLKDPSGTSLHIIHRDISPQNLLVSYEGEVFLADFGIAKAASQSTETKAGVLKGKILYMSPEQAWGKPVDKRSDLYSLGVVFYEMVSSRKIFDADSEFSLLEKVRNAEVEFPTDVFRKIPKPLCLILKKALEKNPEDRYQSAQEMCIDLENFLLTTQKTFSERTFSVFLKDLFQGEINEERKTLIEKIDSPAEKTISAEKIASAEPAPPTEHQEPAPLPKPKGVPLFQSLAETLLRRDVRMLGGILIVLCLLGGVTLGYLIYIKPPPSPPISPGGPSPSSPSQPSPYGPKIKVDLTDKPAAKERSAPAEEKTLPSRKEETPAPKAEPGKKEVPPAKVAEPTKKEVPHAKETEPAKKEVSPTKDAEPGKKEIYSSKEVPKAERTPEKERKEAGPAPKPDQKPHATEPSPQKPQVPQTTMNDLQNQGPDLLRDGRYHVLLERINRLTGRERENLQIRILEAFAHLKHWILQKNKASKSQWNGLYQSLSRSSDRSATPLLIRISKDPEEYTRLYAVSLLRTMGDQRALKDLQKIASSDPNWKIRRAAQKAIGSIQPASSSKAKPASSPPAEEESLLPRAQ